MADHLLLIVRLAGRRVALPAAEVEGVVELDGITPTPKAAAHVAGLSALRSRVLTVIDGLAALEFGRSPVDGLAEAIVVISGGHPYALLVEAVEDVVEINRAATPVRGRVGAGWDRVAAGMVEVEGSLLLLVDPHLLIAGPTAQAA
ncbi:chemotaxis protein CheW [Sphingosinicella terrae]|jgi:purine-binding chemotaxis protein CheW|uniref:chemotaxis protein CheW n=1 Tax=Sphingosinicella terrae TaxID=2172047 RepID=UPI000E0DFE04|nr:chemotaxis protein CheW [Sphingosinicella terrae]